MEIGSKAGLLMQVNKGNFNGGFVNQNLGVSEYRVTPEPYTVHLRALFVFSGGYGVAYIPLIGNVRPIPDKFYLANLNLLSGEISVYSLIQNSIPATLQRPPPQTSSSISLTLSNLRPANPATISTHCCTSSTSSLLKPNRLIPRKCHGSGCFQVLDHYSRKHNEFGAEPVEDPVVG